MAGWTLLKNGSALDCADIVSGCEDGECCLDTSYDEKDAGGDGIDGAGGDCEDKLVSLFEQAVSFFLNEAINRGCIRPLPVLHGDGQLLDLLKLFWVVRKRGGFDLVNGLWKVVAKDLGLESEASASVKLVYFKYLYKLERRLQRTGSNRLGNGEYPSDSSFGLLSFELERYLKRLSFACAQNGRVDRLISFKNTKNGKHTEGIKRSRVHLVDKKVRRVLDKRHVDDDDYLVDYNSKYCDNDNNDPVVLNLGCAKKEFNSRKRRRQSPVRLLNWLIQVAKCPDDPVVGKIPPQSKWKDYTGDDLWIQAIRARDGLFQRRRNASCTVQSLLQSNQRMHHPSMYEDTNLLNDHSVDRARCSGRHPALVKSSSFSCCSSPSACSIKVMNPTKSELGKSRKKHELLSATDTSLGTSGEEEFLRYVAVGPRFQAVVPEWTGVVSPSDSKWLGTREEEFLRYVAVGPRFQAVVPEWTGVVSPSDSKWLGTRVWPLESGDHNASVALDPIGKGRPDLCDCQLPGSVACIRFHIAERRMKLKLEIGSVFYHWRFDHMGDEISLRWTEDEERIFKDTVRLNPPSLGMTFWDDMHKCFPKKMRKDLVSYYFNVFLVRRRSYQNRVTPKNIDSDDDESDFGSLSDGFGHNAIRVPGANIMICSENMQCNDFK